MPPASQPVLKSKPVRCLVEPIEAGEEKIRYERLVMRAEPAFNFRLAQQATKIEPRADIGQSGDGVSAHLARLEQVRGPNPRCQDPHCGLRETGLEELAEFRRERRNELRIGLGWTVQGDIPLGTRNPLYVVLVCTR